MQSQLFWILTRTALALALLGASQTLSSQTPHLVGWHSKPPLREDYASCFQKAYEAVEQAQLKDIQVHDGWVVSGKTPFLRVAISLIQVEEGTLINIQVAATASQERVAERMRDRLKAHIQSARFPDGSRFEDYLRGKDVLQAQLRSEKETYRPLEKIVIEFSNLPTDRPQAWITIVPHDAKPGAFGQWRYTEKQASGSVEFMGLTRGHYEARFHYSNSDKEIRASYPFLVK